MGYTFEYDAISINVGISIYFNGLYGRKAKIS